MADAGEKKLHAMFDKEVIETMRRQFDAADKDGNGQLDAQEACDLFARHCCPEGAGEDEIRKTSSGLVNQLDADRSGTISFEEYCFRFGRRYQIEAARRRRAGQSKPSDEAGAASAESNGTRARAPPAAPAAPEPAARGAAAPEPARSAAGQPAAAPRAEAAAPPSGEGPRLAVGSLVTLEGLRAAPQLNGRRAKVLRFDAGAGRYVVELEGGLGQKSLRPENLKAASARSSASDTSAGAAATGRRWAEKAKEGLQRAIARVQVMLAEYEWWQIALGAAIVVIFVVTYFQLQSRYPARGGGSGAASGGRSRARPGSSQSRYRDDHWDDAQEGGQREEPWGGGRRERRGGERFDEDFEDELREERRPRGRRGGGPGGGGRYYYHEQHDDYDDYGGGGYGGGGHGGGSLFGDWGQLYTLVVLGGLGYMCWTGIIPVHRMSWFQLYMLWNFIEPILLGGRGRGFGGGFGRRRRGFF